MYDGAKLVIHDQSVVDHLMDRLDFQVVCDRKTGEVSYQYAHYRFLKFRVCKNGTLIILGSITKFYQGHNNTDLTRSGMRNAIYKLCRFLNISSENVKVANVEVGLNIELFHPVEPLIDSIIRPREGKGNEDKRNRRGIIRYFESEEYCLKVYDKGAYEKLHEHLLRLELKLKRMKILKRFGIATLKDLENRNVMCQVAKILSKQWSEYLIYDTQFEPRLLENRRDQLFMLEHSHHNKWVNIKSRATKFRRKIKFNDLIKNQVKHPIHTVISEQITEKSNYLCSI